MALFDVFKKKECCICGNEVGLIGNRKLADGNMCSKCAKKLSPWFEDRRESTVAEIQEQLAYREQNAKDLEHFTVSRTIGESGKIHIEEVNGIPTRFFVTRYNETIDSNPDIISFQDVISSVTDIDVRDEEMKQKNEEGKMVSYHPPRFKHHYDFRIKMEIRNNPYFDHISFTVNRSVVTIETVGGMGGFAGAAMSGFMKGAGIGTMGMQTDSYKNSQERRRYEEYRMMCEKIQQAVEDGKRGSVNPVQPAGNDPILSLIVQIRNAPDRATLERLRDAALKLDIALRANMQDQITKATVEADMRLSGWSASQVQAAVAGYEEAVPQVPTGPKFCPNCGAPYEGGKFCQSCGSRLG